MTTDHRKDGARHSRVSRWQKQTSDKEQHAISVSLQLKAQLNWGVDDPMFLKGNERVRGGHESSSQWDRESPSRLCRDEPSSSFQGLLGHVDFFMELWGGDGELSLGIQQASRGQRLSAQLQLP